MGGGLLNIAPGVNPGMMSSDSGASSTISGGGGVGGPIHRSTSSNPGTADEQVYFQTEMYCEAIDGIYQERRNATSCPSSLGSANNNSNNCASTGGSKKGRDKQTVDYFKNLTALEICNLLYLIDLKCFSTLQSIYALFLSKSNTIGNLSTQMGLPSSSSSASSSSSSMSLVGWEANARHYLDRNNLSEFTADVITNILAFNKNFVDSVRILPDLCLVLKKHKLKENKNNNSG